MTSLSAFFVREGALFVPTGTGASPWNRQAHGGVSLGGLVAHVVDRVPCPAPMQVTRITLDILGAIPLEPLSCATRIVREGRRVQLVEIDFLIEGKVWLRASALRLRKQESPAHTVALSHPFPDDLAPIQRNMDWFESISVVGDLQTPGPGACWVRFPIEVVKGDAISPLEAVSMASDFGSGISTPFAFKEWTYANLDISIHLSRLPCSDWLLIDGVSDSAGNGIALSNTRLGDRLGMFGMAHQSVFLERRAS
jgi:hypothetical protein